MNKIGETPSGKGVGGVTPGKGPEKGAVTTMPPIRTMGDLENYLKSLGPNGVKIWNMYLFCLVDTMTRESKRAMNAATRAMKQARDQ